MPAPEPEPARWDVNHALYHTARWRNSTASDSSPANEFYAHLDEAVGAYRAVETLRGGGELSDEAQDNAEAAAEERAISISFGCNVLLFGAKLVAAVMTGSMVVLVSTLDSALDLLSGGILFVTALLAKKPDPMRYPLGKAKMEPLGIVVFSALMGMSALMVAVESIKALSSSQCEDEEEAVDEAVSPAGGSLSVAAAEDRCLPESYTIDIALITAFILGGVVLVKTVLLYYCRGVQKMRGSASVQAYADDHFNDALSNGVSVAVFCLAQFYCPDGRLDMPDGSSVCPAVVLWWLDPLAALLLSLMIFVNWVDSGREQLLLLVGHVAPTLLLQQLTYAAISHEPEHVLAIDKVLAWSVGEYYHAEIDLCLPPDSESPATQLDTLLLRPQLRASISNGEIYKIGLASQPPDIALAGSRRLRFDRNLVLVMP